MRAKPVCLTLLAALAVPGSTAFAGQPDPQVNQALTEYWNRSDFKAFALAVDSRGAWSFGFSEGQGSENDARKEALRRCEKNRKQWSVSVACEILAVGNTRLRELAWPDPPPSSNVRYENRWVEGTSFVIGSTEDLQLWIALTAGSDPQALVYLVNGSDRAITFAPESIVADLVKTRSGRETRTRMEAFSAATYEKKVRTKQAWEAALYAAAVVYTSRPQPQTSTFSGSYNAYQPYRARPSYYGSYYGQITTWPTAADYAAASERSAAQMRAMGDQLAASYAALTGSLLQTHTLGPGTYYGGIVHFSKAKKGDRVDLLIPFGGETFGARFTFPK